MYGLFKYVKERGMGLLIEYKYDEDVIKIEVLRKKSVSIYKIEQTLYGLNSIKDGNVDLLFPIIKVMVDKLDD